MVNLRSLRNMKKNYCLQTFLWGLGLSFLFFLPWIIYNHGYFFFYGDFNVQQIPFYQMIHDSVQSGNIGWSYTTDLGANIIGSYSFDRKSVLLVYYAFSEQCSTVSDGAYAYVEIFIGCNVCISVSEKICQRTKACCYRRSDICFFRLRNL